MYRIIYLPTATLVESLYIANNDTGPRFCNHAFNTFKEAQEAINSNRVLTYNNDSWNTASDDRFNIFLNSQSADSESRVLVPIYLLDIVEVEDV